MNIYTILQTLADNPSRNFKIATLNANSDNQLLKEVVRLALDPFVLFYIKKIPTYVIDKPTMLTLDKALPKLTKLSSREITGNEAITYLSLLLSELPTEDANVIERIIQKDLRCGVSEATVNAVWPNLIPAFPCMLASTYDEKLVSKVLNNGNAFSQLKADGTRFAAIVRKGKVEFRSRNGKEIHIADPTFGMPFIHMAGNADVVYDGELIVSSPTGILLERKTGNGIVTKAVKGTQTEAEGKMIHAQLWDRIPYDKFVLGVDTTPYEQRLAELVADIDYANTSMPQLAYRLQTIPTKKVTSLYEAQKDFNNYLNMGLEGIILKDVNAIWENKRSKQCIKFKAEFDLDAEVIGWVEGTGKYAGMLGALQCKCGDIEFSLGSGFTDEDRKSITESSIVGKIVTVKYNAEIVDKKTGKKSLFLPVYLTTRFDKSTTNK